MCDCQPGNLYKGGLPIWKLSTVRSLTGDAICAYNLLGLNQEDQCYTECYLFPIPCYGYALNIVTPNGWTYPGLKNQTIIPENLPEINNCQDVIKYTEEDGSTYIGMSEPTTLNADQHVFVAYAGDGEYHYARKDTDTKAWSSKNGPDQPTQLDNNNEVITDPSKAFFTFPDSGKLEFCGYFITSNDAVCKSDANCVKGYRNENNEPWSGCGE